MFLSGSGDGERERKREREKEKSEGESSCWWGWAELLQRHTDGSLWKERITCARLLSCHILIPGRAHLGTNFTPLHPTQKPTAGPSHHHHAVIQPRHCQHFHLCAAAVWCQVYTQSQTHFHQSYPNNRPASCLSRAPGGAEGTGVYSLMSCRSVCLTKKFFSCYLRKRKTEKEEKNLLFKIFIFEG